MLYKVVKYKVSTLYTLVAFSIQLFLSEYKVRCCNILKAILNIFLQQITYNFKLWNFEPCLTSSKIILSLVTLKYIHRRKRKLLLMTKSEEKKKMMKFQMVATEMRQVLLPMTKIPTGKKAMKVTQHIFLCSCYHP